MGKSMLILKGFEYMKRRQWNMWKSMVETVGNWYNISLVKTRNTNWSRFATKINFFKRKMCLIWKNKRFVDSLPLLFPSVCYVTLRLLFPLLFLSPAFADLIRSDQDCWRSGDEDRPAVEALSTRFNLFSYLHWLSAPSAHLGCGLPGMSSALPWPLATPTSPPTQEELLVWLLEIDREKLDKFYKK